MKKILIILAIFSLTSCSVTKPNRKDPVQSAVENTMKELKAKGLIN